jgi:hypothetical protein
VHSGDNGYSNKVEMGIVATTGMVLEGGLK